MDYRYLDWDKVLNNGNTSLFRTIDGHPVTFCLIIGNSFVKEKLTEVVHKYGGLVVPNYFDVSSYTVLMVDEKSKENVYDRVAFKSSYIVDCVFSETLLDINDYIHSDLPVVRNQDYMEIIFFRKSKFPQLHTFRKVEQCLNPCTHCTVCNETISKRTPCTKLDENIETSSVINDCESTSHHVEERNNPHSSDECRRSELSVDNSDNDSMPRRRMTSRIPPIITSEDESCIAVPPKTVTTHIVSDDEVDDIGPPLVSSSPRFRNKHTRRPFTRKEKEEILKYIVKYKAIDSVKGNSIWKKMEQSNIFPDRTWMSLQNHFKKSLLKELGQFPFLTSEQIKALRK